MQLTESNRDPNEKDKPNMTVTDDIAPLSDADETELKAIAETATGL